MAIKKVKSGWQVDIQPEGRGGKRIRKTFPRKQLAEQFELDQKVKALSGDWAPPVKDARKLKQLAKDWHELHGHTLKDGDRRLKILENTCERLGNPLARTFTGEDFLRYRKERLEQDTYRGEGQKVSANSVNHEHAYLSAMFGSLIKIKNWKHANPMAGLPKLKFDEPDLVYLELNQVAALLEALKDSRNPDALAITKLCLATGARWSEALLLEGQRVRNGQVNYTKTKNSLARAVPISKALEKEILEGRPRIGRLFRKDAVEAFENALDRAGISLPKGQRTHVLRRTFASHYMIADGNILKLQKILGHKTLAMTMRYARLAPKHLAQALDKNPLYLLECQPSVNANEQQPS